jgi:hypothetical protein
VGNRRRGGWSRAGGGAIQEGRDRAARHATPVPLRACSGLLPSYGTSWSGSDGAQHSTASVGPGLWARLGLRSRPVHICLSQPLDQNPHRSRGTSTPMCWASCTDNGHGGSTAQSCTGEHCSTPLKPTGAASGIRLVSVPPTGVSCLDGHGYRLVWVGATVCFGAGSGSSVGTTVCH